MDGSYKAVVPLAGRKWPVVQEPEEKLPSGDDEGFEDQSSGFFGQDGQEARLFQAFSQDADFSRGWFGGGNIYTGEGAYDDRIKFSGWNVDLSRERNDNIFELVLAGRPLAPQEVLKRQQMFKALSSDDQYARFKEIGEKIIWRLKFLQMISIDGFLAINKAFLSDNYHSAIHVNNEGELDYPIMLLRLNKKILGKDFPATLDRTLIKMEMLKEFLARADAYLMDMGIDEEAQQEQDAYDEEITDLELKAQFASFAADEPGADQWGGKLTRRRVKAYFDWMHKNDRDRMRSIDNFYGAEDSSVGMIKNFVRRLEKGYSRAKVFDIYQEQRFIDLPKIKAFYAGLADKEPESIKQKYGAVISGSRAREYLAYVRSLKLPGEERSRYEVLASFAEIGTLERRMDIKDSSIRELFATIRGVDERDLRRITRESAGELFNEITSELAHLDRRLPSRSFFEIDVNAVREELTFLINMDKRRHKDGDSNYYHQWSPRIRFALALEMLMDERDYFKEWGDLLRSYQSPYLDQMADSFDRNRKDFVTLFRDVFWSRYQSYV